MLDDMVDCPIVVRVVDGELDSVIDVSLVTISVSEIFSVDVWDVTVVDVSVSLSVSVSKKYKNNIKWWFRLFLDGMHF